MSALRISRPGHPTELLILEPATARKSGHGGVSLGYFSGTIVVAESTRDRELRMQRDAMQKARAK